MKIIQLVNTLVKKDAIGNNVFVIDNLLKDYCNATAIYAVNIEHNISVKNVMHIYELPYLNENDIIIYHMCEASLINHKLKELTCKKIGIYHNVTPSDFFKGANAVAYLRQKKALNEIASLHDQFDLCIADSEFNKKDLIKLGYKNIAVMPLIINTNDYLVDNNIIREFYDDDYVNILFVGRIVQNKKQEDIIRIFTYYKKYVRTKSRLILVGKAFSQEYLHALKIYIKDLCVEDVFILENLSFHDIKRIYKSADVFLSMSEHEGFCVPLVEAMLFDVPVIAYASSAVTETLGENNLLLTTKEPVIVAKLIEEVITNAKLKEQVLNNQRERLAYYDYNVSIDRFKNILNRFLK